MSGQGYGLRVAALYAALFVIFGVHVPYFPVWLDWRGLTVEQISIVMAAPLFIRALIAPVLGFSADRTGDHKLAVVSLSMVTLICVGVLWFVAGWWALVAGSVVLAVAYTCIMPPAEVIAFSGVRLAGLDYGRMRLWGSLTFIAVSFATGFLIDRAGPAAVMWMLAAGAAATAIAALGLPGRRAASANGNALQFTDDRKETGGGISLSCLLSLLRQRLFVAFLLGAGAVQATHATFYAFGSLHWLEQGISAEWVGLLWAIGVIAEVVLFAYSSLAFAKVGAALLLVSGAGIAVLRWILMAFDPPLSALIPLQVLHAFTFGASHLAIIHFIGCAVPQRMSGTAQALAMVVAGLAGGLATLAAGWLYPAGAMQAYLAMGVIAAGALVLSMLVWWAWDGEHLVD